MQYKSLPIRCTKRCALLLIAAWQTLTTLCAQTPPAFTPAASRVVSTSAHDTLQSLTTQLPLTAIGPSIFSCRVTDVEVNPADPTVFYTAYASAGLWKTTNNGNSFFPIFDQEAAMTIGDIAVHWASQTIWVGTGENNSSRSSYAGTGIYKSTNDGKTWQYMGLPESHHIGRIVLHPTDPNTVWVAVLGHLYSDNPERGIYKTTDGGQTWQRTLYVNEKTGAIDVLIDETNPQVLYAAMWERERRAWQFTGNGAGSGIYKSTDGGVTWTLLSTPTSRFPTGSTVGRIGLTATTAQGNTILYAVLDNQANRPKKTTPADAGLRKDTFRLMTKNQFLQLDTAALEKYLRGNDFPDKYTAVTVREAVQTDKLLPKALVEYLEDANSLLFDTDVVGAEVYRSDDGGATWRKTHSDYLDDVFYTYGYYFAQIRVAPQQPDKLYIMGVPILRSDDAGKTWQSLSAPHVHADHHALWINPSRKGHLINGNDGGINISYDDGASWFKCNAPPVGQFYAVNVDMATPYQVYGGAQDNGVWVGDPHTVAEGYAWHASGKYPYQELMGGDGMQIEIDKRDNQTVYTGYQFGNYYRINKATETTEYITPKHDLGERPYRWNWQTPIQLSSFNQDILYMGANKVLRSMDKGNSFTPISPDLTYGGKVGNVPYGTLTTLHESPLQFGLLYTGSDDGKVSVTRDGGFSWQTISNGLPEQLWVSRVQASRHDTATVYVSLNGYRWDDFSPYLYSSKNYGTTWTRIGGNLPNEPINVVREDPANANLLYVGTDRGLYYSLDKGQTFQRFSATFPAVPVHDLVIHPREKDLIVGTHGRSLYKAPVGLLQKLDSSIMAQPLYVFEVATTKYSENWGKSWSKWFVADEKNAPRAAIPVYAAQAGVATVQVQTAEGLVLQSFTTTLAKGINYVAYDLTVKEEVLPAYQKWLNKIHTQRKKDIMLTKATNGKYYIYKGDYNLHIKQGAHQKTVAWKVVGK